MMQNRTTDHYSTQANVDRLVRFADGVAMLGLSKSTAYRMLQEDALPKSLKIGALTFFSERELQAWIAEKLAARDAGGSHG